VQNNVSHHFIASCCLGATKPWEKLEVGDSVSAGDSILSGAAPFGAP
jgi:hypothetical protein